MEKLIYLIEGPAELDFVAGQLEHLGRGVRGARLHALEGDTPFTGALVLWLDCLDNRRPLEVRLRAAGASALRGYLVTEARLGGLPVGLAPTPSKGPTPGYWSAPNRKVVKRLVSVHDRAHE